MIAAKTTMRTQKPETERERDVKENKAKVVKAYGNTPSFLTYSYKLSTIIFFTDYLLLPFLHHHHTHMQ